MQPFDVIVKVKKYPQPDEELTIRVRAESADAARGAALGKAQANYNLTVSDKDIISVNNPSEPPTTQGWPVVK